MKPRQLTFLIAACFALVVPTVSEAGVVFTLGNNSSGDEENVLLGSGTTGTTVFGATNTTNLTVQFTSTQTLNEPASGAARIEATSGGSQVALTDITISVPGGTFTDLIFNPTITGTIGTDGGTATVTVVANDGTSSFDYSLGKGNNYLTITTTSTTVIDSVNISYAPGFSDLRQIRISGAAVPEPSSIAIMAVGGAFAATLGLRRGRRRAG